MGRVLVHLVIIVITVIVTLGAAGSALHFTPLMSAFYPKQMEYGSVDRNERGSGVVYYKVPFHTPPKLSNNSAEWLSHRRSG